MKNNAHCLTLLLVFTVPVLSQLICDSRMSFVISTNTSVSSSEMLCTVPSHLVLDTLSSSTWRWDRLTADSMVEEQLTNINTSSVNDSLYVLNVECPSAGIYRALYSAPNGSCLHTCSFFVEVEQIQIPVIESVFSTYSVANFSDQNTLSNGVGEPSMFLDAGNRTMVSVGTCGSTFFSGLEGCLVQVSGVWYKDRVLLDTSSSNYQLIGSSGELRISSLDEATVGDYVCVTTPMIGGLGSFITTAVGITIREIPSPTSPSTTMTETENSTIIPVRALRDWEIGLIVANMIAIAIIVGLVGVCMVCFVIRRRGRPGARKQEVKEKSKTRPVSMIEQIQLMEEEVEEVDFDDPVEIPFSSILFEELLHKGTFKVVHHGVVNYPEQGIMSQPVAVKRLKDDKSELGTEELMGEAYTLRAVHHKAGSHPNVVSMVGMTPDGDPACLLLEYVPHGRLNDFLLSLIEGPVPEWYVRHVKSISEVPYQKQVSTDLMRVLLQVAEGMAFLTDHGFIHRDLSTRTVLIGDRLNVKVSDPGMIHEGYYYVVTEREHYLQDIAPECLWEKRYSVWSDVWSYGILAYKVITMETVPFPDVTVSDMYDRMVGGERPQLLASFSNEMYFLLQRCWQFTATERPSFANIMTDLKDMAEKPAKHIVFKLAKESQTGYISQTGEVFLHPLPYYVEKPSKATKKNWRNSTTQQSVAASSVDDTLYTRDTAETVLDTQSENDNYEGYLRGDLPSWKQEEVSTSSEGVEDQLHDDKGTRVWVESAGSKVYVESTPLASDEGSRSEAVATKKKKKKRGKKGAVNPITMMKMSSRKNSTKEKEIGHTRDGSGSTNDPLSVTEDDLARNSDQSDNSKLLNRSREEICSL